VIALDASALLAFLFREPGHERVAPILAESCLSTVNLSEVIGRFVRDGHPSRGVSEQLLASGVEFVPFAAEDAALAAEVVPRTQRLGLSLGDRACLALALRRRVPVYTADRSWQRLDLGVSVVVIR